MTKQAKDIDINCVVTCYGIVKVTAGALDWVNVPKLAREKRVRLGQLEEAVKTLAAIKWHNDGVLEKI